MRMTRRRALRVSEQLHTRVAELGRHHGLSLALRIGVNTGEVFSSSAPGLDLGTVTGDVKNVAARLQQSAAPGETYVGERTVRACRGMAFDTIGLLELKGKVAPLAAWRLREAGEVRRGARGLHAPMVGRDNELGLLRVLYERTTLEASPYLVTVYGDAGVGKSRLTREFLDAVQVGERAPIVVAGRCLPHGDAPYWPLAEILKGLAGVLDSDPPELAGERIVDLGHKMLDEAVADPALATAALAYTVGLRDPLGPLQTMSPRQVRAEIHAGWWALFTTLAQDRTVVAVIEDVHWADMALLDLLEELVDRTQGPLLLLCTARPELTLRSPAWGGGRRRASSISVEPLGDDEADQLVNLLLTIDDLPRDVHRRIVERAEGNPFFIEEVLAQLIDSGRLVREGGRWRAEAGVNAQDIPDTVQAVLAARLDLLTAGAKRAAQRAAVVGRVFWSGAVAALVSGDEDVADALDELEDRGLAFPQLRSALAGERQLRFKHILTRDVAYGSLPRRERADAHQRVAEWLGQKAGDRRREFVDLLAYHWAESYRQSAEDRRVAAAVVEERRRHAYETSLDAALAAQSKCALTPARQLAEQAVAMATDGVPRSRALAALGQICFDDYRGDEAWAAWSGAANELLAHAPTASADIALFCARAVEMPTRWPGIWSERLPEEQARHYLDVGLANAGDGDSESRARLLTACGLWHHAYAHDPVDVAQMESGGRDAEEAAAMAERLGLLDVAAAALDAVQSGAYEAGQYTAAGEAVTRRLALLDRVKDPREVGDTLAMVTMHYVDTGRYAEAVDVGSRGLDELSGTFPSGAMHCLAWRAMAQYHRGDWDALLADLERYKQYLGDRQGRPPHGGSRPWGAAAVVHERRGATELADDHLAVILGVEDGTLSGHLAAEPVRLLSLQGRFDQARALLEAAMAIAHVDQRDRLLGAQCDLVGEARAWDEAEGVVAATLARCGDPVLLNLRPYADRLAGRAARASGDVPAALDALARAVTGFAAIGARFEAAATELDLVDALVAAGRTEEAGPVLARAARVVDGLGAWRESARASALQARL